MTVMAPDTGHVDTAMLTAIDAATTLTVHRTTPTNVVYPYVKFRCISEVDNYVLTRRAWGRFLYDVTGWDKGLSAAAIKTALGNIATALMGATPTVTGGLVTYLRRVGRVEFDPVVDGVQYQQVVDTWAIEVIPA